MKRFIPAIIALLLVCNGASAQNILGRLTNRAKNAAENAVGNRIERGIEEAINGIGTKNENAEKNGQAEKANKPESMAEIQKVADYMLKNKTARFEVQGHCDNQGSDKVNDPLSQKRAEAIVTALVKMGVDEWNLRAVGKGSHEPVADNKTEEGRAKNRRVEFIKK